MYNDTVHIKKFIQITGKVEKSRIYYNLYLIIFFIYLIMIYYLFIFFFLQLFQLSLYFILFFTHIYIFYIYFDEWPYIEL